MATLEDFKAVARMIQAEDRERLGELPDVETLFAYVKGRLGPEEEACVREFFVAYPELYAALTEPFPEDDGAEPLLTPEEIAEDWRKIRERMAKEG